MLTFFITTEEKKRAQTQAAELDISKSEPSGQYPYVWDNRQNTVNRWYDYSSPDNKIGTITFELVRSGDSRSSPQVKCTTEITQSRGPGEDPERRVRISDNEEHERLVGFFFMELLNRQVNRQHERGDDEK